MSDRPVGYQHWRDLLFMHWALPPERVRPLVPSALALDLLDGQAWVTLIPFDIPESRPAGMPRAFASRLLEVNLRTYVRGPEGEAGIYFWSLEASSLAAVVGARALYGLPYYPAAMVMRRRGPRIDYSSRRRVGGHATLDVSWTVEAPIGTASPGTRDEFLVERYILYVARRARVHRARVHHRPYPLRHAHIEGLDECIVAAAGLGSPGTPALCHYSPGVDVEIFWRHPV